MKPIMTLTTCLALLSATGAHAHVASLSPAFEQVMAVADAAHLAGEIVVADAAGTVMDRTTGLAERATRRLHRAGQRWLWASVTKQVTAVLVLQQVDAGRLALDQPIERYLPAFAGAGGATITLRQLLRHQSGLPNPDETAAGADGVPAFYRQSGGAIGNMPRALGFCAGPAKAPPTAGFAYNNCDYLVLGAILEAVTGQSYAALVRDRVARPLGLRSLGLASDGARDGGGAAKGYTGDQRYPSINVATFGASGALTGTARDLIAFDRALLAGALVTPASRALLWQGDAALGYEALGVWSYAARLAGCAQPVALVERRGDVGGIQVRNVIAPDLGRAVAVFVNDDSIDFGEVWQGKGVTYDMLSAAFCPARPS